MKPSHLLHPRLSVVLSTLAFPEAVAHADARKSRHHDSSTDSTPSDVVQAGDRRTLIELQLVVLPRCDPRPHDRDWRTHHLGAPPRRRHRALDPVRWPDGIVFEVYRGMLRFPRILDTSIPAPERSSGTVRPQPSRYRRCPKLPSQQLAGLHHAFEVESINEVGHYADPVARDRQHLLSGRGGTARVSTSSPTYSILRRRLLRCTRI